MTRDKVAFIFYSGNQQRFKQTLRPGLLPKTRVCNRASLECFRRLLAALAFSLDATAVLVPPDLIRKDKIAIG